MPAQRLPAPVTYDTSSERLSPFASLNTPLTAATQTDNQADDDDNTDVPALRRSRENRQFVLDRARDPLSARLLPTTSLRRTGRVTSWRPRPNSVHKPPDEYGSAQQLKLEMIGCDGGSFDNDDDGMYTAENVLRNDTSVYCTAKVENVNIALRSAGGKPFTLSRIVIKAPQRSFTSPVHDGLIFVSLDRIDSTQTDVYDGLDQSWVLDEDAGTQHTSNMDDDDESSEDGALRLPLPRTSSASGEETHDRHTGRRWRVTRGITGDQNASAGARGALKPNAYFQVDEQLGIAEIDFDPPIAGRYVHVKLLRGLQPSRRRSHHLRSLRGPHQQQPQQQQQQPQPPPNLHWLEPHADSPRSQSNLVWTSWAALQRNRRDDLALARFDRPESASSSTSSAQPAPAPASRERYYDRHNIDVQAILFYGWGRRVFPHYELR